MVLLVNHAVDRGVVRGAVEEVEGGVGKQELHDKTPRKGEPIKKVGDRPN